MRGWLAYGGVVLGGGAALGLFGRVVEWRQATWLVIGHNPPTTAGFHLYIFHLLKFFNQLRVDAVA
jgi:hypothetical protein